MTVLISAFEIETNQLAYRAYSPPPPCPIINKQPTDMRYVRCASLKYRLGLDDIDVSEFDRWIKG